MTGYSYARAALVAAALTALFTGAILLADHFGRICPGACMTDRVYDQENP